MASKGKHISSKLAEAKEAARAAERAAMLVEKRKEWAATTGEVVRRIKTGDYMLHQQVMLHGSERTLKKLSLAMDAKEIQKGTHRIASVEHYPMEGIKSVWDDLEHFHAGGFE